MLGGNTAKQFIGGAFLLVVAAFVFYGPFGGTKKKSPPAYLVGEFADKSIRRKGQATLVDASGHILRRWPLPFSVHKVSHNNARPWQLLAVEDNGKSLALMDARTSRSPDIIEAPEGFLFNGHGLFSSEGDRLFVTVQDRKTAEGFVYVYDTTSMNLTQQWGSGGISPHDLQFDFKDSQRLLVVNKGNESTLGNLVWLQAADGQVLKTISVEDSKAFPKHVLQATADDIFILGQSFGRYSRSDGKFFWPDWKQRFSGEVLNAYFDSFSDKIWLSLPDQDSVLVLERKTLNLVKEFKAEKPRSILGVPPLNPDLLLISVAAVGESGGLQRAYNLKNITGSDAALEDPRKFYAEHATPLEVAIQETP